MDHINTTKGFTLEHLRYLILMFDSIHSRTCLHYAAHYGHSECLHAILSAAHSSPVSDSWGFVRFVNVRDGNGATPLHLAARQRRPECVHLLLDSGALVCAPTSGGYGCQGSTPLHLAARGGSLDCIRALLAWGADRLQRDASGRMIGKELNGLSFKELQNLENQLNDGIISVKNCKEQRAILENESLRLQVEELRSMLPVAKLPMRPFLELHDMEKKSSKHDLISSSAGYKCMCYSSGCRLRLSSEVHRKRKEPERASGLFHCSVGVGVNLGL